MKIIKNNLVLGQLKKILFDLIFLWLETLIEGLKICTVEGVLMADNLK